MDRDNGVDITPNSESSPAEDEVDILKVVKKLTKDLKLAAVTLSDHEARFLVGIFYLMQDHRKRSNNQIRALKNEPHITLTWFSDQFKALEDEVRKALEAYSKAHKYGGWLHAQTGVGPIIAAGLLAHIDITKAPTAGHIWSFAGLVPGVKWNRGEKRPWNAELKTLCWKIGESFVKFSASPNCFYGHLYIERKEFEINRNAGGEFASEALRQLKERNWKEGTEAIKWYKGRLPGTIWKDFADIELVNKENLKMDIRNIRLENLDSKTLADRIKKAKAESVAKTTDDKAKAVRAELAVPGTYPGMLPPGHIHSRAKRYVVKLFLAHFQEVTYELHYGKAPPKPYPIAILGHAHKIEPPMTN